jgi:hypothetical protein
LILVERATPWNDAIQSEHFLSGRPTPCGRYGTPVRCGACLVFSKATIPHDAAAIVAMLKDCTIRVEHVAEEPDEKREKTAAAR